MSQNTPEWKQVSGKARNPEGMEYSVGDLDFNEFKAYVFMTPSSIYVTPLPFTELAK